MHYWPTSIFLRNPLVAWEIKQELLAIGQPGAVLSPIAMVTCHNIAAQTPSSGTSMVLIKSEGTPNRRAYLKRPDTDEWLALERGGFVSDGDNFGFSLDALH